MEQLTNPSAELELKRFEVARNLIDLSAQLIAQSRDVLAYAAETAKGQFRPEDGTAICVTADPGSHLEAEESVVIYHNDNAWSPVYRGSLAYPEYIATSEESDTFLGTSMELDNRSDKIWIYNENRHFRVLYSNKTQLNVIALPDKSES